jgi:hypothetical protein
MLFESLRRAACRGKTGSHRRVPISQKPGLESLEERDLLATLVFPQTSLPTFTATFNKTLSDGSTVLVSGAPVSGGNFLGMLNGNVPLTASYCVDINQTLFPNNTYANATVTSDGTAYGAAVPHADAISWLVTHLGPTATTPEQQDALQAAIWRTEYGDGFQLDNVDNDNGAPSINSTIAPIYKADLAALGTNTAPVSAVTWISPGANPGLPPSQGQALVALTGPPISTPAPGQGGSGPGSGSTTTPATTQHRQHAHRKPTHHRKPVHHHQRHVAHHRPGR